MKDKDQHLIYEAYNDADGIREVHGMRREVISQLKTVINYLDKKELERIDYGMLDVIGSQVSRWVNSSDMESAWDEPIDHDVNDDEPSQSRQDTDQEKYGYPEDRG